MFIVRGIGVADMVRTLTVGRSCLIFSFCRTPNRCSSSMIRRPKSRNFTSLASRAWVPTTMSTVPAARSALTRRRSAGERRRLRTSIRTGMSRIRSVKVTWCWWASTVVGTSTAT